MGGNTRGRKEEESREWGLVVIEATARGGPIHPFPVIGCHSDPLSIYTRISPSSLTYDHDFLWIQLPSWDDWLMMTGAPLCEQAESGPALVGVTGTRDTRERREAGTGHRPGQW